MNKLTIIGNLTRDPELRTTTTGRNVCTFNVAVNRRKRVEGQPEADFFRVSAWNDLADICAKFLTKGKKVCVIGPVSIHTYNTQKGEAAGSLEVKADEVEFISPRQEEVKTDPQTGYQQVSPADLPY